MRRAHAWIGLAVIATAVLVYGLVVADGVTRSAIDPGSIADGDRAQHPVVSIVAATVVLTYAFVGGLLLWRLPGNVIGVILAFMGVVPLLGDLGGAVARRDLDMAWGGDLLVWTYGWYFFAFLAATAFLIQLFPTGRPLPGWWSRLYLLTVAGMIPLLAAIWFGPFDEGNNPFGITAVAAVAEGLWAVGGGALLVGVITGLLSQGVRFHRSKERPMERAQLKWFFYSVALATGIFVSLGTRSELVALAALALPAIGILVALTRHHLYDIDRLVSRTVTYAVVAAMTATIYAVPVLVLPDLLGLSGDLAVAGATLAAAAAFSPLRRWVQRRVEQRFNRAHYDAEQVLAGVAVRLRSVAVHEGVVQELGQAAAAALRPQTLSVWLRAEDS